MAPTRPGSTSIDDCWRHALHGLRVEVVRGRYRGLRGEIAGTDQLGIHVVPDGEKESLGVFWGEWKPEGALHG